MRKLIQFRSYLISFFHSGKKLQGHLYTGVGYAVAQLVEALRYKLEGRRFDSRRGRNMALRSNQPLTKMSTRDISWRVVKAADA
jgi:hypothetical protein